MLSRLPSFNMQYGFCSNTPCLGPIIVTLHFKISSRNLERSVAMWVYTTKITKDGKTIYAKDYGKKAFCFWVDKKGKKKK